MKETIVIIGGCALINFLLGVSNVVTFLYIENVISLIAAISTFIGSGFCLGLLVAAISKHRDYSRRIGGVYGSR
jgi:hypothetical protein